MKTKFIVDQLTIFKSDGGDGAGMIEGVFSSSKVDREGDIVEQDWDTGEFERNPMLLFNHNSDMPIGRVEHLDIGKKRSKFRARLSTIPLAQEIRTLVSEGIVTAASHRFRVGKMVAINASGKETDELDATGYRYSNNKLVEISTVSIPANLDAAISARAAEFPAVCKELNIEPEVPDFGRQRVKVGFNVLGLPEDIPADEEQEAKAIPEETIRGWASEAMVIVGRLIRGAFDRLRSKRGDSDVSEDGDN